MLRPRRDDLATNGGTPSGPMAPTSALRAGRSYGGESDPGRCVDRLSGRGHRRGVRTGTWQTHLRGCPPWHMWTGTRSEAYSSRTFLLPSANFGRSGSSRLCRWRGQDHCIGQQRRCACLLGVSWPVTGGPSGRGFRHATLAPSKDPPMKSCICCFTALRMRDLR